MWPAISRTLQIVQSAGSGHLTEDACFGALFEHHAMIAVADGAPVRLRPVASLRALTDKFAAQYGADVTPSGVASRLVRDTVARHAPETAFTPLSDIMVEANARLAAELCAIYGELSAEAVLTHEPSLTLLAEEPRALRLMLPVCTYTAVRVDFAREQIEVAHGADSALLLLMADGSLQQITPDQMAQHDEAFKAVYAAAPDEPAQHPFFRALGLNRASEIDRLNGLYHNYVAPDGALDPTVGVSVVDGLPQMRDYMFTAIRPLTDVQAVLVVSDGVFWPSKAGVKLSEAERLGLMAQMISERGLVGYIDALRAEESCLGLSHDDATAVMLRLAAMPS
ncbi:hypothetical protein VZO05_08065 [Aggregatilineales bacterium SYSU G02658]